MMKDILEIAEKIRSIATFFFTRLSFTDAAVDATAFPFYGTWKEIGVCNYQLLVHPELNCYIAATSDITAVLIGHVYNPFDGLYNEKEILENTLRHKIGSAITTSGQVFYINRHQRRPG